MLDFPDYSVLRDMAIKLHNLSHMDDAYTFFYDETNNSRLFRITDEGFNSSKDEDFVLGGLAYDGNGRKIKMDDLLNSLKMQSSVKEIKRKNIAPGNTFLECMKSVKLQALLEWTIKNEIFVHFTIMNNLYYGIADIVDSLGDGGIAEQFVVQYNIPLKNALYKYMKKDIVYIHQVFVKFNYPNIAGDNVCEFCNALIVWIDGIQPENELDDFALKSIRQLLEAVRKMESLCFLTDNDDLMLIDGYESLYMQPIYMFPNSQHIFDIETEIINKIQKTPIIFNGAELHNYSFVDSADNKMIQFSDVMMGVIGKLMLYANSTTQQEISEEMSSLSPQQTENICLLSKLIYISSEHCSAFTHYTANFIENEKVDLVFSLARRNRVSDFIRRQKETH